VNLISQRHCIGVIVGSVLALAALAPPVFARSQTAGNLSRWLSADVVPELSALFSRHPRYQGQRIEIVGNTDSGLTEAIGSVLSDTLAGQGAIALVGSGRSAMAQTASASIDQLACVDASQSDYLLKVTAGLEEAAGARVHLVLMDASAGAAQISHWQWRGELSPAERQQFESAATTANGSLTAPWSDGDIAAAAAVRSRDFACALRPQIHHRLGLQWLQEPGLPVLFADIANISRHKLGGFRELGISDVQPDYTVSMRLERFQGDIWQMWLTGTPRHDALTPVQAVTYFKSASPGVDTNSLAAAVPPGARASTVQESGPALDFIDVQLVDTTQADKGWSRAELQVTLRLSNRAQQAIAYSFMLSGGHFERCIAEPGHYRHDDYGLLAGELEPGVSVLRRLVIENAEHRPVPLYGVPKCAGFRDLQGFEKFASEGYRVTEYVRWAM